VNPTQSNRIEAKRGIFRYGVFTPYTDRGACAIFTLDWRLAVEEQIMPEKPAESGMTA
jgi:hypothetical protein